MNHTWTMSSLHTLARNLAKKCNRQHFICWIDSEKQYVIRQKAVGDVLWIVEPSGNIWS